MQLHDGFENCTIYSTCDFDHQKSIDIVFIFIMWVKMWVFLQGY